MIHPHTQIGYISDEVGFGVIATQFIPAGTITWVLDDLDQEFTPEQFEAMEPFYKNIMTYTVTAINMATLCFAGTMVGL